MVRRARAAILSVQGVSLRQLESTPALAPSIRIRVPTAEGQGLPAYQKEQMVMRRTSARGLKCVIAVGAAALTTLGGVTPQQALAEPTTWRAPYDGTVLDTLASPRAEVPLCTADAASGAVAGKVLAHAKDASDSSPSGQCMTGMTVTNIRVPGSHLGRRVDVTGEFHIDSAVADVPAGQTETGANSLIAPCIRIVDKDGIGSNDWDTCNYWWDPNNAAYTPLSGPHPLCVLVVPCVDRPTPSRVEVHDKTWTWRRSVSLSQGTYEVRAYLMVYASNNDPLVGPVTAEVDGTVTSVQVDIGS